MTEAEWKISTEPAAMLEYLYGKVGDRKLRLFAVSCCRCFHRYGTDHRLHEVANLMEVHADFPLSKADFPRCKISTHGSMACDLAATSGYTAAYRCSLNAWSQDSSSPYLQVSLLRDIFGNSFRPVASDPAIASPTVRAIAAAFYEANDFTSLPILADALLDAGCNSEEVMAHCLSENTHAKGCWLIDVILGKE